MITDWSKVRRTSGTVQRPVHMVYASVLLQTLVCDGLRYAYFDTGLMIFAIAGNHV